MIEDPARRGASLGEMYLRLEPALWSDITDSDLLGAGDEDRAHREWECFALYACVRGLVAAGGFDEENVRAIDALHDAVAASWDAAAPGTAALRREHAAKRYDEYGELVRRHAAEGDDIVTARLGESAARHVSGTDIAHAELGIMLGELHEAIVQGAAESVRAGEE